MRFDQKITNYSCWEAVYTSSQEKRTPKTIKQQLKYSENMGFTLIFFL